MSLASKRKNTATEGRSIYHFPSTGRSMDYLIPAMGSDMRASRFRILPAI